jgi:hypothetical protein
MAEEGRWRETVGHGFGTGRHKGTTKTWAVRDETNGKVGGYQTEHWNDRVDADVRPKALNLKLVAAEEGD